MLNLENELAKREAALAEYDSANALIEAKRSELAEAELKLAEFGDVSELKAEREYLQSILDRLANKPVAEAEQIQDEQEIAQEAEVVE